MLGADQKLNLHEISNGFKNDMVEVGHKFNVYAIVNEFKIVMVVVDHKFHMKFLFLSIMDSNI